LAQHTHHPTRSASLGRRPLLGLLGVACMPAAAQNWDRFAGVLGHRAPSPDAVWAQLKAGGLAVLIRHTTAPGRGDPANFDLARCDTQRNLNDVGRQEARSLGDKLRAAGVPIGQAYTSQYCRVAETARLALGAPTAQAAVSELPILNSSFELDATRREQLAAQLRAHARGAVRPGRNTLYFSHAFNIDDAYGIWLEMGELLVVKPDQSGDGALVGKLRVVG
jgi:hypothetical protein